jgi:hypothetical protein
MGISLLPRRPLPPLPVILTTVAAYLDMGVVELVDIIAGNYATAGGAVKRTQKLGRI